MYVFRKFKFLVLISLTFKSLLSLLLAAHLSISNRKFMGAHSFKKVYFLSSLLDSAAFLFELS